MLEFIFNFFMYVNFQILCHEDVRKNLALRQYELVSKLKESVDQVRKLVCKTPKFD